MALYILYFIVGVFAAFVVEDVFKIKNPITMFGDWLENKIKNKGN